VAEPGKVDSAGGVAVVAGPCPGRDNVNSLVSPGPGRRHGRRPAGPPPRRPRQPPHVWWGRA